MAQALALQLYERFLNGESVNEIALDLGIPADRIQRRLEAAATFAQRKVVVEKRVDY